MKTKTLPMIYGDYRLPRAARLVGLPPARVRRLFAGRRPLFPPDQPRSEDGRQYIDFPELIAAFVAGHLAEAGVPLPVLRRLTDRLRAATGAKHPYAHERLKTDGPDLFLAGATDADRDALAAALVKRKLYAKVLKPAFDRIEYDPGTKLALSWMIADRVMIDPRRRYGRPIVLPAYMQTDMLAAEYRVEGGNAQRVARWHEISVEEVLAAVAFERRVAP